MSDSNIPREENLPVVDLDVPNQQVDSMWGFIDKVMDGLARNNPGFLYKILFLAFVLLVFSSGFFLGRYYFEYIDLKEHFARFHQDMTDVQEKFLLEQFRQKIKSPKTNQSVSR